jgi:hypothetical protein
MNDLLLNLNFKYNENITTESFSDDLNLVKTAAVPLPAALYFLSSGVLVLIGFRRKIKLG